MKTNAILALVAAAGALGWVAGKDPPASQPVATSEPAVTARTDAPQGPAGAVTLPRSENGHFYAPVTIDGRAVEMLVDTGASVIALTGADAAALGFDWNEDEIVPVGRGASGTVMGKAIVIDQVQMGDLAAERIDAVIVPAGLTTSLLGQSFLSRIGPVEMQGDTLLIGH
ncbi:TIGR02281 family clan AA aspartic protease [Altererythrobacter xixiisoli]|uniref:TIGR02281 family clan AA aspartic protease n=1 Tax=Croceibacterium xixiisoli TaxID=1476466 RepID=A0A6I4TRY0_9SPHN|nr:TIGR02281 family clan AA aspartic protease [Croceibacterium xixiisoli]MXO97890.1 TIGR02281 family clan AA aspartic protease [Croceibacterium xixiisoli]